MLVHFYHSLSCFSVCYSLALSCFPCYAITQTQFMGTRDVICPDWITEYIFGGMQYQLEHHLFPTMPRYKYRSLAPVVEKWAKENGLDYKADSLWTMLKCHWATLEKAAAVAARELEGTDPYALTTPTL